MADLLGWTAVTAGSAVGAPTRYLLDRLVQARRARLFPWGTFTVNFAGSLPLGVLTGLARHHGLGHTALLLLGAGFCGGLTTFSTFGYKTWRLLEERAGLPALLNVLATLVAGVLAVGLGLARAS